jgi:predicted MFS family arabinose efflux permease
MAERTEPLPRAFVALLAFACGAAVANLWYIQPLLNAIASTFHADDAEVGLLVTAGQLGYVAGLALLVPLGDLLERRRLITTVMGLSAIAAAGCALAPGLGVLALAIVALGVTSVVAQVLVPLSSQLAAPTERGQVVGTVMGGLLIGILASRTLSGLIAEVGGWRLVFAFAAVLMAVLALVLRRALPVVPPTEDVGYRELLRSIATLVGEEPILRQRMAIGALVFAGFTALWTSIAFLLGAAPFHYGEGVIGLFGLAGMAGALAAIGAGRLFDRGLTRIATTGFLLVLLVGWAPLAFGDSSAVWIVVGLVIFDLGVQGAHVSNQNTIYALRPEARGRLTTAYMVSYFLGGVVGSLLSTLAYDMGGWQAVCGVGVVMAVGALTVWAATQRLGRDRRVVEAGAAS